MTQRFIPETGEFPRSMIEHYGSKLTLGPARPQSLANFSFSSCEQLAIIEPRPYNMFRYAKDLAGVKLERYDRNHNLEGMEMEKHLYPILNIFEKAKTKWFFLGF